MRGSHGLVTEGHWSRIAISDWRLNCRTTVGVLSDDGRTTVGLLSDKHLPLSHLVELAPLPASSRSAATRCRVPEIVVVYCQRLCGMSLLDAPS